MIYITDTGTNILVEGDEIHSRYPYNGTLSIPYNSTLVILDEASDMVVFKNVANYDTQFTAIIGKLYIQGRLVTKANVIEAFNAIANVLPRGTSEGGGGESSCCSSLLYNQNIMISMMESLTNDHVVINNMLDSINNEYIDCTNIEDELLNEINDNEITC